MTYKGIQNIACIFQDVSDKKNLSTPTKHFFICLHFLKFLTFCKFLNMSQIFFFLQYINSYLQENIKFAKHYQIKKLQVPEIVSKLE
jgi:hypothetical protein